MDSLDPLETFRVEVADHVATVTIRRPPVNAQNGVFRDEITRIFDTLHESEEVRAIVLTGDGRTFSAGADLRDRPDAATRGAFPRHSRAVRAGFDCVMECGKPVIAAVNGPAIGAGCVLALVCDIVLVAEDAFMSMTEVDVGLAGGVQHVLRHFGQSDARMFLFTARRLYGPELHRMRVASGCFPKAELLPAAQAMAREIAGKAPLAVAAMKRAFTVCEYMPLHEGYRFEQTQTAALAKTEDTKEGLRAFAEKRRPVFRGR
ncbi:enoyl-CoA hydratase/isomerase family protein [Roseomonas eburnea]|uniref:Enoyl-CoA hydratase/isomerase family protein n=1 Tax=Neoroseomonas eburnea TaxID=1346889 RepID=A0A9X9XC97_9PROT|nr:enoyl-CoA hydratase/isomerase family protein [Neoroseomonas eburnea]MBR0681333.1 enoyl-CoA hydratase/isomerase family protein [Neoroseomonas eburnea]